MRSLPSKIPETGVLPGIRQHAVVINQILEALRSMELRESPNVRIERTSSGTTVHVKKGRGVGTVDDTWYGLAPFVLLIPQLLNLLQ